MIETDAIDLLRTDTCRCQESVDGVLINVLVLMATVLTEEEWAWFVSNTSVRDINKMSIIIGQIKVLIP